MHVLGTRVSRRLGVARSASSPKEAQALGCSLAPGLRISFGRVTCMARAASVPGLWALGFLLLCGVCVWVRVAVGCGFRQPCQSWLGSWLGVFGLGLWCCPSFAGCFCGVRDWALVSACFWDVCGFVRAPLAPVVSGSGVRCGRVCWARVSAVPRPSWLDCRGVFFALFFLALWCRLFGVPVPGLVAPVPPSPFFRAGLLALYLFLFFSRGVCLHVSVCVFPVGRCSWLGVAGFGWVVPLCLFGGPVFGAFRVGGLAASCGVGGRFGGCGLFSRPPPPVFFWGGGLPVPSSAFPGLAHALARIQCGLPGCCWRLRSVWPCSGPMGRVGYVHVGLGAPSCRVRSWLCRLGGCARRLRVALG